MKESKNTMSDTILRMKLTKLRLKTCLSAKTRSYDAINATLPPVMMTLHPILRLYDSIKETKHPLVDTIHFMQRLYDSLKEMKHPVIDTIYSLEA